MGIASSGDAQWRRFSSPEPDSGMRLVGVGEWVRVVGVWPIGVWAPGGRLLWMWVWESAKHACDVRCLDGFVAMPIALVMHALLVLKARQALGRKQRAESSRLGTCDVIR